MSREQPQTVDEGNIPYGGTLQSPTNPASSGQSFHSGLPSHVPVCCLPLFSLPQPVTPALHPSPNAPRSAHDRVLYRKKSFVDQTPRPRLVPTAKKPALLLPRPSGYVSPFAACISNMSTFPPQDGRFPNGMLLVTSFFSPELIAMHTSDCDFRAHAPNRSKPEQHANGEMIAENMQTVAENISRSKPHCRDISSQRYNAYHTIPPHTHCTGIDDVHGSTGIRAPDAASRKEVTKTNEPYTNSDSSVDEQLNSILNSDAHPSSLLLPGGNLFITKPVKVDDDTLRRMHPIDEAMESDVLFGRGHGVVSHSGNKAFGETLKPYRAIHSALPSKLKRQLVLNLVTFFQVRGVRFLQKVTGKYFECGTARVVSKVHQFLREKVKVSQAVRTGFEQRKEEEDLPPLKMSSDRILPAARHPLQSMTTSSATSDSSPALITSSDNYSSAKE